jgi:FtsZ-interacting cell division protein ZipA
MRYSTVGFWLLTLIVIVVVGLLVDDQLTRSDRQIQRLLEYRETALRERERAEALAGQVARSSEELDQLRMRVASAGPSLTQECDLKSKSAAANADVGQLAAERQRAEALQEEIKHLKDNARSAADATTALAAERQRAEALHEEIKHLKDNARSAADATTALPAERQRAEALQEEVKHLKDDARSAADATTALAAERQRAEALSLDVAQIRRADKTIEAAQPAAEKILRTPPIYVDHPLPPRRPAVR